MSIVALLLALIVLAIAPWSQIPAPTYGLRPLSIGAPELSAWLLVLGGLSALFSVLALRRPGRRRTLPRLALALSLVATAFPVFVLAQIPSALRTIDAEWFRAFKARASATAPIDRTSALRPHPFTWREMFVGLRKPVVQVIR
ncbi:MAG: hypothetical protein ABIP90_06940, partial [Vicinamibacterales bacterium]